MADNENLNVQIVEDLGDPIPGSSRSVQENSFYYPVHERIKTGFGRMVCLLFVLKYNSCLININGL